jgi:hypothetical protein
MMLEKAFGGMGKDGARTESIECRLFYLFLLFRALK